ncbi:MAG: AtpZ/AtpI family protein [Lachnospiraceae bacterium]
MKYNRTVFQALAMIGQFGINILVPVGACSFAGGVLDRWLGTSFLVIILFFVGAVAGFWNIYRFSRKIFDKAMKKHIFIGADRDPGKNGKEKQERSRMKEWLLKVNRTLFELETGILLFALACQVVIAFFPQRGEWSRGLWIGILRHVYVLFICGTAWIRDFLLRRKGQQVILADRVC